MSSILQVCDSDMKILSIDPRFAGSCHDGHVWRNSGLRRRFMSGRIVVRDGEFLLGDSAYPLEPWLLTPVPGHPDEDTPEGVYNKEHAALRSTVERCIASSKAGSAACSAIGPSITAPGKQGRLWQHLLHCQSLLGRA
ncbi:putative nuclease HARBI1 [Rhipicephalus sanguineus]|uniref:putative nuclease HARBI1 n=1 Tax=Rhipicephalus sanguineus TaxID=34632 RepID=UPI0020C4532D|nr:putative nuclease HARBI1 [Rhipicephalus sanguineus]